MEETISLQDLYKIIRKRLVLIVSMTVIAMLISAIISFFLLTPIYQSSTQILVNQQQKKVQDIELGAQDIQTNLQLINTYNVIIKSPAILSKVIEELDLQVMPEQLTGQITVSNEQNSQVVNISVQDADPVRAANIANTVAQVFQKEIPVLMNVDNVNILAPAELVENPSPVKPNKTLNIAIAAVVGLMIGVGLAFLLEYLDTTIKTEQDVEDILQLPIIGLISPISDNDLKTAMASIENRRGKGK